MHQANLAESRKSQGDQGDVVVVLIAITSFPRSRGPARLGRTHERRLRRPATNNTVLQTSKIFWFKIVSDSVVSTGSDHKQSRT